MMVQKKQETEECAQDVLFYLLNKPTYVVYDEFSSLLGVLINLRLRFN